MSSEERRVIAIVLHQEEAPDDHWSITISSANYQTVVSLADPFSNKEHQDYTWYLEQYLQQEPFAETRAKPIARSIRRYGQQLINDLGLHDLIKQAIQGDARPYIIVLSVHESTHTHAKQGLYWEVLEDPALWNLSNLEIVVHRVSTNSCQAIDESTTLQTPSASTHKTINVLVLTARALNGSINDKDEVDPFLAVRVLLAIEDWLRQSNSSLRLKIDVVRPGSLQALTAHLQNATACHGKGYYEIVHLDVHGILSKQRGAKFLLSSSNPDVLETIEESPQEVGNLLNTHGIKNVIVNACRSATLYHGKDSNMAQLLMASGLKNVLGMAFDITANAVSVFLATFYYALIVDGLTFPIAACAGRTALRIGQKRQARLGLQKKLVDYAIPLLYCQQKAPHSSSPKLGGLHREGSSFVLEAMSKGLTKSERSLLSRKLIGRDFDLLRLERQLLSSRRLYVSGRPGVGKTAFLHHATEIWQRTNLVDLIVHIDCAKDPWESLSAFHETLLSEPYGTDEELEKMINLKDPNTIAEEMYDMLTRMFGSLKNPKALAKEVWNIIGSRRMVLVLDGLHKVFSHHSVKLQNMLLPDHHWMDDFVSMLVDLHHKEEATSPVLILLASRRATESHKFLPDFLPKLELGLVRDIFCLDMLRLSDSLELARLSLDDVATEDVPLTKSDHRDLELVLRLLKGVPGAILSVIQFKIPAETWSSFRERFIKGSILTHDTIDCMDISVREEFSNFCASISLESMPTLYALGLFWDEAPRVSLLFDLLLKHKLVNNSENASRGVLCALDRGFLELTKIGEDSQISWLHPIFVFYMRYFISLAAREESEFAEISTNVPDRVTRLSQQGKVLKQMKVLALTLSLEGSAQQDFDQDKLTVEAAGFRQGIVSVFQAHGFQKWSLLHVRGWDFGNALNCWSTGLGNLATCLRICLEQSSLPLSHWPLNYLTLQIIILREIASPSELSYFATQYVELLDVLCIKNGGIAFGPSFQSDPITLSRSLATIWQKLQDVDKSKRFADLSLDIVEASEKRFGPYQDSRMIHAKANVYYCSGIWHLENGKLEQARRCFQQMRDIDSSLFKNPKVMDQNWSAEHMKTIAEFISSDKDDRIALETMVKGLSSGDSYSEHDKSHSTTNLVDMFENFKAQGESFLNTRQFRSYLAKATYIMKKNNDRAQARDVQGISMDEQSIEDLHEEFVRLTNPMGKLQDLEYAESIGDEANARRIESSLKVDALLAADFCAASTHFQRLQKDAKVTDLAMEVSLSTKDLLDYLEDDDSDQTIEDALANMLHMHDVLLSNSKDPQEIETLTTLREMIAQSFSSVESLPHKSRQQEAARLRNLMRAAIEFSRNSKDQTSQAEIQSRHTKILKSYQDAMILLDVPSAIIHLDELEQLLKEPQASYFNVYYSSIWFYEHKTLWQMVRQSSDMKLELQTLSTKEKWVAALSMIHRFADNYKAYQIDLIDHELPKFVKEHEIEIMESILEHTGMKLWHGENAALKRTTKSIDRIFTKLIRYCEAAMIAIYHKRYTKMMQISQCLVLQQRAFGKLLALGQIKFLQMLGTPPPTDEGSRRPSDVESETSLTEAIFAENRNIDLLWQQIIH